MEITQLNPAPSTLLEELDSDSGQPCFRLAVDIVSVHLDALREALRAQVASQPEVLVLDLSHVQMVDSAGLGLLLATHNSLRKHGGRLELTQCSEEVIELFVSLRLNQHIRIQ